MKRLIIILQIAIGFFIVGNLTAGNTSDIITLTDANFQKETSKGIVLVDFWATWCYPCKVQGRILENMMPKVPKGVKIGKLDTDVNRNVSSIYGIRSIPTLIILKDGQVVRKFVGVKQEAELLQIFKELQNE